MASKSAVAYQAARRLTNVNTSAVAAAFEAWVDAQPDTAAALYALESASTHSKYQDRVLARAAQLYTEYADDPVVTDDGGGSRGTFAVRSRTVPPARPFQLIPERTMVTTWQPGHGWTVNSGTWAADTTDKVHGVQSVVATVAPGPAATYRRYGLAPLDTTNRDFAVLIKVDNPVNLSDIKLYLGTGNMANFRVANVAAGGISATTTVPPNEWTWVYFSSLGAPTGTPDMTAITDYQLRIVATGSTVTCKFNALGHYPRVTDYPSGVVSLTCDDGRASAHNLTLPKLTEHEYGMTTFVIVEYLNTVNKVTEAQLDVLQAQHGWEVAGHAYGISAHNNGYTSLTLGQLEQEVRNLRSWLVSNGHKGADLFAYPLGNENATVRAEVSKFFTLARQIVRVPLQSATVDQPMRVRSYSLASSDTLAGMRTVVDQAQAAGCWLIFTFHDLVTGTPTVNTQWPIADFNALLDYIASKGMPVRTVGDVLDTIHPPQQSPFMIGGTP